jgi:hypothetical protein
MSSPQQQEWQQKIKNLKIEVDAATEGTRIPEILPKVNADTFNPAAWQERLLQTRSWFEQIPASGKLAVIVGAAIGGLMLLKTVFQLVTSLITLAVVAVILSLVYRYFITPKTN